MITIPSGTKTIALIMDDPDAMAAVGKVWVHWLEYHVGGCEFIQIPTRRNRGINSTQ